MENNLMNPGAFDSAMGKVYSLMAAQAEAEAEPEAAVLSRKRLPPQILSRLRIPARRRHSKPAPGPRLAVVAQPASLATPGSYRKSY